MQTKKVTWRRKSDMDSNILSPSQQMRERQVVPHAFHLYYGGTRQHFGSTWSSCIKRYTCRLQLTRTFNCALPRFEPPALKLASSSSSSEEEEDIEEKNAELVSRLYDGLRLGKRKRVQRILAPDLEWWFHGPPNCQNLMRFLSGRSLRKRLLFSPLSVTPLDNKVFVEGREDESQYWVHVWTVENGIVTQLREYFNTSLIVKEFKSSLCIPIWQSALPLSDQEAMPGLLLAL